MSSWVSGEIKCSGCGTSYKVTMLATWNFVFGEMPEPVSPSLCPSCGKAYDEEKDTFTSIPYQKKKLQNDVQETENVKITIERQPVTRCRDCKLYEDDCGWCDYWNGSTKIDNFCGYGERKE